jgi:hypothetical protein
MSETCIISSSKLTDLANADVRTKALGDLPVIVTFAISQEDPWELSPGRSDFNLYRMPFVVMRRVRNVEANSVLIAKLGSNNSNYIAKLMMIRRKNAFPPETAASSSRMPRPGLIAACFQIC